jgi:hypothetical protein
MRIISPDEARTLPFQDPDNDSLDPFRFLLHPDTASTIASPHGTFFPHHLDQNAIFMERVLHIPGGYEYVFFVASPIVGDQESVTIPVAAESAGYEIVPGRKGVAAPPYAVNHSF